MLNVVKNGVHQATSWGARLVLLALIAAAPWYYGSARWHAQVPIVYVSSALAVLTWLAILTAPQARNKCLRLVYCMLAFMLLIAVQIVPLPSALASELSTVQRFLENIAPQSGSAAPVEWLEPARHNTLSISAEQTRASLAVFGTAVVAVWSASVLFVSRRMATTLVITVAVSGLLNAFLGLLQAVSWNDWTLLPMPTKSYFSTFVSRNSAATYFACVTGAILSLLGVAYRNQKRKRRQEYRVTYPATTWLGRLRNRAEDVFIDLNSLAVVCICAATFMIVATLATLSRGGTIACIGASLVTLGLTLGGRGSLTRAVAAATVVGGAVISVLMFLGLDTGLLDRMDQINEAAYTGEDGRLYVWGYTLRSLQWYWLGGSGFGTFHFALLPFHDARPSVWFYHAESVPLEIASTMGIAGFAIAAYALWLIFRQLFGSEIGEKERVLRIAVTFATCAICFQSLVDFGLILPGVFLPYCALVGAYMGRCQRIEMELAERRALGAKAGDARLRARLQLVEGSTGSAQRPAAERWSWFGHTAVMAASLCAAAIGLSSLTGFAAAELLEQRFKETRAALQAGEEVDTDELQSFVRETLASHAGHPEVELQTGRAEELLWHSHATSAIDWGPEFDRRARWRWSDPQVLTAALRASEQSELAPLQTAIESDRVGMELGKSSFQHYENALRSVPLDSRAAWGLLGADGNWLDAESRSTAHRLISQLAGNNPQVLTKVGIAAVREGDVADGLALLRRAIEIQPNRLGTVLPAIVESVDPAGLLSIIPDDAVLLAQVCRQLSANQAQWPRFQPILLEEARRRLDRAEPTDVQGWLALSWVARETGQLDTRVQMLRRALAIARGSVPVRFELAQALYAAGKTREALEELDRCIKQSPSSGPLEALKTKWSESVDHKQ